MSVYFFSFLFLTIGLLSKLPVHQNSRPLLSLPCRETEVQFPSSVQGR